MLTDIPQYIPSSVCLKCDVCCRFEHPTDGWRPKVGETEKPVIDNVIRGKKWIDPQGFIYMRQGKGQCRCMFFNTSDQTCQIYKERPFECILYPFLLMEHENQPWIGVHLACPHIQKHYGDASYQAFAEGLKTYFRQDHVTEFLKANPSLVRDFSMYRDQINMVFPVDVS